MPVPANKPTIDTCNACGKLFPRTSMRLCTHCSLAEEHRFALVREYLEQNDGAPIAEIANGTGVSSSDVRRFCEGGRLVEMTGGMDACTCSGVAGERCRYCRSRLSASFRTMEQTMRIEQGGGAGDAGDDPNRTSYVRRMRRVGE